MADKVRKTWGKKERVSERDEGKAERKDLLK